MRTSRLLGVVTAALTMTAFTVLPSVASSGSGTGAAVEYAPVCLPSVAVGVAHCNAIQLLNPAVNWHGTHRSTAFGGQVPGKRPGGGGPVGGGSTPPPGYNPADIQSAYGLASYSTGSGGSETVAIVDAYNDPNAESDLAAYRLQWQIPSCGSGCFTQVAQNGSSVLPKSSASWSEEISLDLDMVSAVCPKCHILLVEAKSASIADLATAVSYAAARANVVSNSYGSAEFSGETSYDSSYQRSGVVITASAGDSGYGVEYPAASPYVTAVGGTTLTGSATAGWSQTVWSGTGSGCSAYETNPGWQPSTSACSMRTVADTAAVADPNTGVAVYDSFREPGWMVFGGTSVASPIIASVYALAGDATLATAKNLYGAVLNQVTTGSNGTCGNYLCNAAFSLSGGYNGPTGNGTPNGVTGF